MQERRLPKRLNFIACGAGPLSVPACALAVLLVAVGATGVSLAQPLPLPLPAKTDIPEDFSTVICPDEPAARRMLRNHHVEGRSWFDSPTFMRGLELTGCKQLSGPLQIKRVLDRKTLRSGPSNSYILYEATRPDGGIVYGTVHEEGNNRHPRTPLDRWFQTHAPVGWLQAKRGLRKTYVCQDPQAAKKVVAAIPPLRERGVNNPHRIRARDAAIRTSGCTRTYGRFRIAALHDSIFISTGYEAGESWTALTATDPRGRIVGLLHDADTR